MIKLFKAEFFKWQKQSNFIFWLLFAILVFKLVYYYSLSQTFEQGYNNLKYLANDMTVNKYWTMMVNRELLVTNSVFVFFLVNTALAQESKSWIHLQYIPINGFHFLLVKFLILLAGVVLYILLLPLWIKFYTLVMTFLIPNYQLNYHSQIILTILGAIFYCSLTFLVQYIWRSKIQFAPLIFLISLLLGAAGIPITPNSLFLAVNKDYSTVIYAVVYSITPILTIIYLFKNAYDRNNFKN